MVQLEEILGKLPPVTRCYLLMSTLLMILCSLEIISPFSLYLNWMLAIHDLQLWRLVTCFLFFGTFGLHFFWNAYVLLFYCSSLEDVAFHSRPADFLWMLITSGSMLLVMSYFIGAGYFFSGAITNVMTYVWGRKNPSTRMNVLFFTVRAPYLPWVLASLSMFVGWHLSDHLMGIAVGHIYFFFEDIYPYMPTSKGLRLFATPKCLKWIMNQRDD